MQPNFYFIESLGCILTAPQRASALSKTKTSSQTAGGPQIIQYLCQYKEEQPEGGGRDKRTGCLCAHPSTLC